MTLRQLRPQFTPKRISSGLEQPLQLDLSATCILLEVGSLVGSARVPVCPWIGVVPVCPCARVPVCPCARGSGCARVPVCPGQRQVQKSRSDTFAGSCSLSFGSPNRPSTVRGSYGRCKGRCLIWVLLTLVCSLLPVNFRMVRLL